MKNYNPSIVERANRIFNLKNGDQLPEEIDGPIATIEIRPVARVLADANKTTSGSGNIGSAMPSDKDTYVTAVYFGFIKDATCDASTSRTSVQVNIGGATQNLISLPTLTTTAQADDQVVHFNPPVKIDRGATFAFSGTTYTVGNMSRVAVVWGYNEEVTRT